MGRLLQASLFLAALASFVRADGVKCSPSSLCPEETPCCSQYGECGTGAYCLGGCDPLSSSSLKACVPAPVCQSKDFDFKNLNGIQSNTKYLGDAKKADWVSSGEPIAYGDSMLLTMAEGTVGTLLASSHYIWYGKIKGKFKTSAGAGVVTAFILLSDVKDEIDFEFVGTDLTTAQTNFYSLGVTNYSNGKNTTIPSNSMENYHEYEIDWKPDQLTWSIDGEVVRTLKREETWNATADRYTYPQTPARLQLSLWPAGLPSNPEGTVSWGGGLVQWDSQYMTNGYYYAQFDKISIECYDPPSGANIKGDVSYLVTDKAASNASIEVSDNPTVLKSLLGSGLDMDADYPSNSASATGAAATSDAATIPGLTGAGPGTNGQRPDDGSDGSDGTGSPSASSSGSASTGFVQGSNGASSNMQSETVLSGSLFAVVVAIVGLCVL